MEVGGYWERCCHVDQGLRYFDNLHVAQGRGSALQRGRSRAGAQGSAKQIDIINAFTRADVCYGFLTPHLPLFEILQFINNLSCE